MRRRRREPGQEERGAHTPRVPVLELVLELGCRLETGPHPVGGQEVRTGLAAICPVGPHRHTSLLEALCFGEQVPVLLWGQHVLKPAKLQAHKVLVSVQVSTLGEHLLKIGSRLDVSRRGVDHRVGAGDVRGEPYQVPAHGLSHLLARCVPLLELSKLNGEPIVLFLELAMGARPRSS